MKKQSATKPRITTNTSKMKKQSATKPRITANTSKPQLFTKDYLTGKQGFYIMLALLGGLILFVFKDFIFMHLVMLYKDLGSDSINGHYPLVYHVSDYLHNMDGVPKWTFYQGMGQDYLGYLSGNPFELLLYFVKPENVQYAIAFSEILKFFFAGLLFYLFLKELKISSYPSIMGSVCYAFCAMTVVGSTWWETISVEPCIAAFMLYSLEKLLNNKWYYFPFAIAFLAVSNPFHALIYIVVIFVYTAVRLYCRYDGWNKKILGYYLQIVGLSILGIGVGAFFFYHKTALLLESSRVSNLGGSITNYLFQTDDLSDNLTKIGRLFSNDMLGYANSYQGSTTYNYMEAPLFYMGIINLLLFTQIFTFLTKKQRWIFLFILTGALLPVCFPFARYFFWGFTWKYFRNLAFFFSLVLLIYSVLSLHFIIRFRKINNKLLLTTLAGVLMLLFLPNILGINNLYQSNLQFFCLIFLILYAICLHLIPMKKLSRYITVILTLLVCIEVGFMAHTSITNRYPLTYKESISKVGYNDYSIEAVQAIQQNDTTAFYRMYKTYGSGLAIHKSYNDQILQKFYGTISYTSFNQANYVKFLKTVDAHVGWPDDITNWLDGLPVNRPLLQIFGNVHYNLSNTPLPPQLTILNDSIGKIEDIYIYKHKHTLPFGYTYSKYMLESSFLQLPFKDVALLKAVIIADAERDKYSSLQLYSSFDIFDNYNILELAEDVERLKEESFRINRFTQNNIEGEITIHSPKLLFFTIPFDKNWKVYDNGKKIPMEIVNIGFSGVFLESGHHLLELRFEPANYYIGIIISLIFLLITSILIIWDICRKRQSVKIIQN